MATLNPIRILIAEDHLVTRVGLVAILNAHHDLTVVAEATDGQHAIALYREYRPDVAVIDMRMPVTSGYEAVAWIRKEFPQARFVALSTYGRSEDIQRAVQAGVHSYLTKDVLDDEIVSAVRIVNAGKTYFAGRVAAMLNSPLNRPDLSSREVEVLELVVPGLTNKQIAVALGVSEFTVKNHIRNILSKLAAEDRTQAVVLGIQQGVIHLDE
jgi:DNA-binding NarL/FixJ family response regulator